MRNKDVLKKAYQFLEAEKQNNAQLFTELSLYIYQQELPHNDLHILAKLLSMADHALHDLIPNLMGQ